MKKLISLLLCALLLVSSAWAEGDLFITGPAENSDATQASVQEPLPEVLNVVNSTQTTGAFFTDLWSRNTADMDVRALLHGLATCVWLTDIDFDYDPTVVKYATSYDNADGSRTYMITLNSGLTWSDGSEVTASDYVFSILLQAGPELNALGADSTAYYYIVGYEDFHAGNTDVLSGVGLYGNYMFSVTVKAEYLPFFYEKTYVNVTPYPINVIAPNCYVSGSENGCSIKCSVSQMIYVDENGTETAQAYGYNEELLADTLFGEDGYATHPAVVSGPYMLTSYDAETGYAVFEANLNYPGDYEGRKPAIAKLTLSAATPAAALEGLENGTYNLYVRAVSNDIITEGAEAGLAYVTYPRRGMGYINFICSGTLSDATLRQALSCAFDKEGFVTEYLSDVGMTAEGYYGLGQWMTQAALGLITPEDLTPEEQETWASFDLDVLGIWNYDTDKAVTLMGGRENVALTYALATDSDASRLVLRYMQAACDTLGITLSVKEMTFNEMLTDMMSEEPSADMYFLGNNFDQVFDPCDFFSADAALQGTVNQTRYSSEQLTAEAEAMRHTDADDLTGYLTAWYAFEQDIADNLPVLPLYTGMYADLHADILQDYDANISLGWVNAVLRSSFGYPETETETSADEILLAE